MSANRSVIGFNHASPPPLRTHARPHPRFPLSRARRARCRQLHAYRLLDTVIQTYASIRPSALSRLNAPCTSMAERVGYWYWTGKLSLAKGDVRRVSGPGCEDLWDRADVSR